jgi:hypothetical protein
MATTTYGSPYVSGTDLVANWPAASLTVAQSIDAAGYYIGRGNNTQTGSYTTVLTDAGKVITMSNASANTVTIPANSSVAYVIGSRINILNLGAGACTPTAAAGVTISGTITALATNGFASLVKTATNTWSYMPPGGFPASATATVATSQSTSTLTFTDLTTAGPAVTVTTGTKALVIVGAYLYNTSSGGGGDMGYAVSGATTVAATQTTSLETEGISASSFPIFAASRASFLTGLTAGSNTFTAKYRAIVAGACNFRDRQIIVIDMGS